MMTKCQDCERGPAGQAGHESLYSHAFSGGRVVLKCRACGTCWSCRASGRDFEWHEVASSEGSLLPAGGG
jgi:hypothetical protein